VGEVVDGNEPSTMNHEQSTMNLDLF
jgi:hypothetical protein